MSEDCKVVLLDLPTTISGFVREVDGYKTVVLNSRMAYASQCDTYRHELEHIEHDDLHKDLPADQIEAAAHGGEK